MRRACLLALILSTVSCANPFGPDILTPAIDDAALPDGRVGVRYSTSLQGDHVSNWSVYGGLPPGLSLSERGALTGTPTTAGTFSFTAHGTQVLLTPPKTVSHGYALRVLPR
jgi:hypothetical protein